MNCEYCLNMIKTCPLTLNCCGYIVCYEHYTDLDVCPICSSRFDMNECLLFINTRKTDFFIYLKGPEAVILTAHFF